MNIESTLPTIGQLERTVAQSVQKLLRQQLGIKPTRVFCKILREQITIIAENTVSNVEKILIENDQLVLANQMRNQACQTIKPQIKELITSVVGVPTQDLLCDTVLETGYLGIVVILAQTPEVRMRK
ncbi:hypothetical protein NIES4102_31630 [Chondrocystis sp. NIES-4102]|nr:hypothetical protein NIES4102_31630 [Chondrocystis sp. NIES-4102]